jgi:hypothetical protein
MIRMKDGAERSKVCNWEMVDRRELSERKQIGTRSLYMGSESRPIYHQPRLPVRNHTQLYGMKHGLRASTS